MDANDLTKAGYQQFVDSFRSADRAFQKRIRHLEDGKTLYFINVYEYDYRKFNIKTDNPISYEVETCLYFDSTLDQIRVQFNCGDLTVTETEEYVEHMYNTLGCVPDKHND